MCQHCNQPIYYPDGIYHGDAINLHRRCAQVVARLRAFQQAQVTTKNFLVGQPEGE